MYVYLKTKSKSLYRYTASAYYETDGVGMAYMWQIKLLSHHENKTQLLMSLRVGWIIKLFMKSEANKWRPFGTGGWILIPNQTPDKTPLGFHLRWNMFFISVRSNTCILMRCFYYRVTKLVETTTTKIIIIIIIINSYMYSTFLQVSQGASHLKIESYLKTSSQSLQSLKLINDSMKIFLKTWSLHVCLQSFLTNVNRRAWFNVKRRGIIIILQSLGAQTEKDLHVYSHVLRLTEGNFKATVSKQMANYAMESKAIIGDHLST